jgi:hypothetical protein
VTEKPGHQGIIPRSFAFTSGLGPAGRVQFLLAAFIALVSAEMRMPSSSGKRVGLFYTARQVADRYWQSNFQALTLYCLIT